MKSKFSEEFIIAVLKEGESGIKISDLIRKHGISDATYYNWKSKYGWITESDLRRFRDLEKEIRKLKHINAKQALDIKVLQEINKKNW